MGRPDVPHQNYIFLSNQSFLLTLKVMQAWGEGMSTIYGSAAGPLIESVEGGAVTAGGLGAAEELFETGSRRVLRETEWEAAEAAYNEIRASTTDVAAIAEKTGFPEAEVNLAKDHLFHAEHVLDNSVRRFDADPYIANAWDRLVDGMFTKNDLMLLRHEIYEANYERAFNSTYREAHEAALKAGYVWEPEP
jgi:hypothetical protein